MKHKKIKYNYTVNGGGLQPLSFPCVRFCYPYIIYYYYLLDTYSFVNYNKINLEFFFSQLTEGIFQ